jgi:hypothetical protein
MKFGCLIAIVFAAATLLYAQNTKAASDTTAFDGTWSVMVDYREYKNPDGTVALPWVIHCQSEVKNGVLHAEHETKEGTASWELNGKIAADGTATLSTTGITEPKVHPISSGTGKAIQVSGGRPLRRSARNWQICRRSPDPHLHFR